MKRNDLATKAIGQGWTHRYGKGGHNFLQCPCGQHSVVMGASSSDRRAVHNNRALLRRCPTWKD